VRRIANRFNADQADFEEIPAMSHWLIGEPEWPLVAQLTLEWLAGRGVKPATAGPARKKALKPLRWGATTAQS
jgi:hypothetical protein